MASAISAAIDEGTDSLKLSKQVCTVESAQTG
ncbi:hypothetical protein sync_2433 [Synechococcus sp. CC9311]|nr:hypothetical protein sync_2433 [Synechococcus sp. CC9311]